jgi:glycerol-3-phosphate dehydrogenase (NAD(P)+)
VKNVIALACGITEGMGLRRQHPRLADHPRAAETTRLGVALGAEPTTVRAGWPAWGPGGHLQLPAVAQPDLREKLGRGLSLEEVQATTRQTAEGVKSCRSVLDLARAHGVDVPVTEAVVRVCHEDVPAAQMVKEIMSREAKPE